jgi:hypothetical protein
MKKHLLNLRNNLIAAGNDGGAYLFRSPIDNKHLKVIVSWGLDYDHVSVSREDRTPTWQEMEWVLARFAEEDEYWVQYHVPKPMHVNMHPNCLHWFRPQKEKLPTPPQILVGFKK